MRMKKTSNQRGNGHDNAVTATRKVTQKHKEALAAANIEVTSALAQLGALAYDEAILNAKKAQAVQAANQAIQGRQSLVDNAALAMDIDIKNEPWTYDFDAGEFKYGQQPGTVPAPAPLPSEAEKDQKDQKVTH